MPRYRFCSVFAEPSRNRGEPHMGRALLLFLIGVPIPVIILLALIF
jgi:hypothetical protein